MLANMLMFWTFFPKGTGQEIELTPTQFSFEASNHEQFSAPVGEAVGFDLSGVNGHPFHIHINPFQLTVNTKPQGIDPDWFRSGDWHDTLKVPNSIGQQRVLMV